MTNIKRTVLAMALAAVSATPVFAQHRTIIGVPVIPQPSKIAIVETTEIRDCRLHCGSLAATPNMKRVPTAVEQQMRADSCAKKMIRNR
jgi:hypothetical protein